MKIQPYVEKLHNSSEFNDFKKKHSDAYLVAGFFVLDFETNQHIHQIDYYIPSEKKIAAFTIDENVTLQVLDTMNESVPEKLDIQTNVDLEAIRGILEDGMKNRNMTEDIKKIIAVIQNLEGKKIWVLNCILSGMEILKAHIHDESKDILKMEKSSVLDYVKKVPGATLPQGKSTPEDIDKQMEQLDKLKQVLEKEKESIGKTE